MTTHPEASSSTGTPRTPAAPTSPSDRIRVLIADDQRLIRTGFAMIVGTQPDMEVVGMAVNGVDAVRMARALTPDVVLMDVRMPVMDGIEATSRIVSSASQRRSAHMTRVIILTTFDLDEYVMSAISAGASGFLLKDAEPETLLDDIRTVAAGTALIEPEATSRLLEEMANRRESGGADIATISAHFSAGPAPDTDYIDPEVADLTDREREILVELAHGLSNKQIAEKLSVSLATVKTHVNHILAKTNSRDRIQAAVFAYNNHLL